MFIFSAIAAVVTTVIAGSVLVYRKGRDAVDAVRGEEAPLPEKKR